MIVDPRFPIVSFVIDVHAQVLVSVGVGTAGAPREFAARPEPFAEAELKVFIGGSQDEARS